MPKSTDTQSVEFRRTRRLRESGGSKVLTIPPEVAELAAFTPGDELELEVAIGDQEIVIRKTDSEN